MQNNYVVYKHTSPSGKSYIGLTKDYVRRCRDHQDQIRSDCRVFKKAIAKYGWENFTHEILFSNLTRHEAQQKERELIEKYNSIVPNGYNLTAGGENCVHNEETKQIISEKLKKFYQTNPHPFTNITEEQKQYALMKSREAISLRRELHDLFKEEYQEKFEMFYPNKMYPEIKIPDGIVSWKPKFAHLPAYDRKIEPRVTEVEKRRRWLVNRIEVLKNKIPRLGKPREISEKSLLKRKEKAERKQLENEIRKNKLIEETLEKRRLKVEKGAYSEGYVPDLESVVVRSKSEEAKEKTRLKNELKKKEKAEHQKLEILEEIKQFEEELAEILKSISNFK